MAGNWPHFAYAARPASEVCQLLNQLTTVIVILETPQSIEHASGIAAVPCVDILHIGSTDLCDALGVAGQFDHSYIEQAFKPVIVACSANGKITGAGGLGGAP